MKKAVGLTSLKALAFSCVVAIFAGCVSRAPSYDRLALRVPRVKAGYARVIFYCDQPSSFAREHDFICYLDDIEVGHISTRQFLYMDHAAGQVEVKAKTTTNPLLPAKYFTLNLEPGDVRYVRLQMKFSYPVDIGLANVDAEKGEAGAKTCTYAGQPPATHAMR